MRLGTCEARIARRMRLGSNFARLKVELWGYINTGHLENNPPTPLPATPTMPPAPLPPTLAVRAIPPAEETNMGLVAIGAFVALITTSYLIHSIVYRRSDTFSSTIIWLAAAYPFLRGPTQPAFQPDEPNASAQSDTPVDPPPAGPSNTSARPPAGPPNTPTRPQAAPVDRDDIYLSLYVILIGFWFTLLTSSNSFQKLAVAQIKFSSNLFPWCSSGVRKAILEADVALQDLGRELHPLQPAAAGNDNNQSAAVGNDNNQPAAVGNDNTVTNHRP